jgi:peptidylprolyl isomerase
MYGCLILQNKEIPMIESGQYVTVHYTGTLENGDTFDSTEGREPFEFRIGDGLVIPKFEETVRGMAIDEEKQISIKSADAYGDYRDDLTQRVPVSDINQYLEPKQGLVIQVMLSDGSHAPALIKDVTAEEVMLDFNHPLAGSDLNFNLKLVAINSEPTQNHECSDGCEDDCSCSCGKD